MNGNCRVENVLYKCVISATEKSKVHVHIDVAESDGKQRYYNQTMSLRNQGRKYDTGLSTIYGSLRNLQKKHLSFHGQF